jgi:RES domain
MWTPIALASEAKAWNGPVWRVVESTSKISTLKLVDTLDEQSILEDMLERSKPPIPPTCANLHYLLSTPFRYAPHPHGSRFLRADQRGGVFYGSEHVETAIAEIAFYRLLFFSHAPSALLPANPVEHTAFCVPCLTPSLLDLTLPPLSADDSSWTHLNDYTACQTFADTARVAGIGALRYRSVRDPDGRANIAVLSPTVFAKNAPDQTQTWSIFVRPELVQAVREFPRQSLEFRVDEFKADSRLADRDGISSAE